jgi:hypothetical protein
LVPRTYDSGGPQANGLGFSQSPSGGDTDRTTTGISFSFTQVICCIVAHRRVACIANLVDDDRSAPAVDATEEIEDDREEREELEDWVEDRSEIIDSGEDIRDPVVCARDDRRMG